ncbi:hypothetical protein BGY98DRAFT_736933 [Russula aff. rugulosa BPL654]|nr:hypothetical protein BGY98DRAFT_736933 [Russula aff. rugulosa BPL654]
MTGSPINISGRTAEFRPPDNRHLMVHECSAFGPGEMQAIRDFVIARNHESCASSERLHAIWICVPLSDVIDGQFDEGARLLLDIGVPLVLVFTKFDLIVPKVSSASGNDNGRIRAAYTAHERQCRSLFRDVPAEIVSTRPRFRDLTDKLVQTTDGLILAHSRKVAASSEAQRSQPRMSLVPLAWSVSQRASRDINILTAIEVGRSKYWRALWSSDDFRDKP